MLRFRCLAAECRAPSLGAHHGSSPGFWSPSAFSLDCRDCSLPRVRPLGPNGALLPAQNGDETDAKPTLSATRVREPVARAHSGRGDLPHHASCRSEAAISVARWCSRTVRDFARSGWAVSPEILMGRSRATACRIPSAWTSPRAAGPAGGHARLRPRRAWQCARLSRARHDAAAPRRTYAACLVCGCEQIGGRRDPPRDPQIAGRAPKLQAPTFGLLPHGRFRGRSDRSRTRVPRRASRP